MTKRHFEAIARMLRERVEFPDGTIDFDSGYRMATRHIAFDLADYFEEQNPRFDRQRFLTACGITV